MWTKWFPWRFIVRRVARAEGFIDPMVVLSQLQRFAQPSEVVAPVELLRMVAVLQARGLMNSQAIQHNLDWIWPHWVVRQFDPSDDAFIPRAFSITHINLTHRNWTAVGLPSSSDYPIIDPRGLVTPFYDGWSLDSWVLMPDRENLIPSKLSSVSQKLVLDGNLAVETKAEFKNLSLTSKVEMFREENVPVCQIAVKGRAGENGWLAISLRPYNPEGVSFIHHISKLEDERGWKINNKNHVYFNVVPDGHNFSHYREGDVYRKLPEPSQLNQISCDVGMATAAALFQLKKDSEREVIVQIPLKEPYHKIPVFRVPESAKTEWDQSIKGAARLSIPDQKFQFLYAAALKTTVLHSSHEVYPGPFTYKHFWFRDAAMILHALLCAGLIDRVEKILDSFPSRQTPLGYFRSQDGEWDSNGQVLWVMQRFCELSGKPPKREWKNAISQAAHWIRRKRLPENLKEPHAGLFPPGFSAEHLGPNDYYYWDNFWGVRGLKAAAELLDFLGEEKSARDFQHEANSFLESIERSLNKVSGNLGHAAMPASLYRRMDAGAIGSLAASYPLQLWPAQDERILATADYLLKNCFVLGGFFHDVSHSGINAYLTLHVAQILLRAGDKRYFEIMKNLSDLASPTGQWPEAIHPRNRGGCMGDGQHVWAAAEWMMMIRNCFVREEDNNRLMLCSGVPLAWLKENVEISFGPAPTTFGMVHIRLKSQANQVKVSLEADWHRNAPQLHLSFPRQKPIQLKENETEIEFPLEG
ncbi:MAG: hypothetical protein HY583_03385 [Candidatus Omnitrophica bacterium]|nr:hypothetical protein [Candidatus Omnitrophota bacterium]